MTCQSCEIRKAKERRRIAWVAAKVSTFMLILCAASYGLGWASKETFDPSPGATVAGTRVPIFLRCQEDEAIAWTSPNTLGCVNFEELVP